LEIAGGTANIALVDRNGNIRCRRPARTLWGRPALATLEPYLRSIEYALACAESEGWRVRGIGVALPGTLDDSSRHPLQVPILPSLNSFPLCDFLEARYGLPARICVDVDAVLIGEYYHGAGRGYHRLLYLTLNTVVGASSIIDGRLSVNVSSPPAQAHAYLGHVAHVTISAAGPRCGCGKRGCINSFVSQEALQKMVLRALRRDDETSLSQRLAEGESLNLQVLLEEAQRGDGVARHIYGDLERCLCEAVARFMRVFEPDMLILGGTMPGASPTFLARIHETGLAVGKLFHIATSQLGSDAVLIGAAASYFHRLADPVTEARIPALYTIQAKQ
jgi:glucokinase